MQANFGPTKKSEIILDAFEIRYEKGCFGLNKRKWLMEVSI